MNGYKTVEKRNLWEQIVSKSRFIGIIAPVNSVEEAEAEILRAREEFPNATHYVYAWRIEEGHLEKSTDDGEPQGTGGKPVIELLQHKELWNVVLIVIRYFGGTLLGTGGLIRAYGGTARHLIEQSSVKILEPFAIYSVRLAYSLYEKVKYYLNQEGWAIGNEEFDQSITIEVYLPEKETARFLGCLEDLTCGQALAEFNQTVLKAPLN